MNAQLMRAPAARPSLSKAHSWPRAPVVPSFPQRSRVGAVRPSCFLTPTRTSDMGTGSSRIAERRSICFRPQCPHLRSKRQVTVQASWGAPVDFKKAKVVSNKIAAPGMHSIILSVGDIALDYTKPGQYIQAKVDAEGKAGFFAIASAPGSISLPDGQLELLIKIQPGATAEAICALGEGADILVSPVQGKGFPIDRIPEGDYPTVLMFATGSGISPIKAVIESGVLGKRTQVGLYYGTKSSEATAYQDLIPTWMKTHGVEVTQVFSGSEKKYVQDAFKPEASKLASPKQVGVLLCGQKDMAVAITETLKGLGVEQILSNF